MGVNMVTLKIILRAIHIGTGVFWVGAALTLNLFITDAVKKAGPNGPAFMGVLVRKTTFMGAILWSSIIAIASGVILWLLNADFFQSAWMMTGTGTFFTIGGIAGIAGAAVALAISRPASFKVMAIGQAVRESGGAPTDEQASLLATLQKRLASASIWNTIFLIISVLLMATAQYVVF